VSMEYLCFTLTTSTMPSPRSECSATWNSSRGLAVQHGDGGGATQLLVSTCDRAARSSVPSGHVSTNGATSNKFESKLYLF
jgi:hypothetical protein